MTDFKSLNLAEPVQQALVRLNYTSPTPIQQKAIPGVLAGKDLMGIAQTGTGKTAAFSLPSLSHIANNPKNPPKRGARVLILAPTRELASQIAVSVRDYGVCMPDLSVTCVFGGVPIARQIKRLVHGNDVLVATPGRLIDLINRKDVRLGDVEVLILDEADQMMDMGFIHALRQIVPHVPKERQTLFFSATMTPQIKKLAAQFLTDPVHVSIAPPNSTADKIEQSLIFIDKKEKQDLLALTLLRPEIERALIFTRTKHGADRVVKKLARVGIEAVAIHGNKSQGQRTRALAAFREAKVRFLIATDIAARGIDIEGITHVINFEIPNVPEQYVHRIGRTARAGREGRAIAFVDTEERSYLKGIQKLLKIQIPTEPLPENFKAKSAEVNKRPALPKPERTNNNQPRSGRGKNSKRKNSRGKNTQNKNARSNKSWGDDKNKTDKPYKPKRPKAAKPAEQEAGETSGKPSRPPHAKSPQGQTFKRKKKRLNNSNGHPGGKPGGRPQSESQGKPQGKSGGKPGGRSQNKSGGKPGGRPHGRPQNKSGGKPGGKSKSGQNRRNNSNKSGGYRGQR